MRSGRVAVSRGVVCAMRGVPVANIIEMAALCSSVGLAHQPAAVVAERPCRLCGGAPEAAYARAEAMRHAIGDS